MNIIDLLKKYDEKYEKGEPEVSDTEYDKLRETAQELHPEDPYFKQVGAPKGKVKLPYLLGSLNKVKLDTILGWLRSVGNDFVISEKLDGTSFMVTYEDGVPVSGYTRGDGEYGKNISNKVKLFCPKISMNGRWVFRGEAILPDCKRFGYKNRRNGAAGLLNKDDASNCQYLKPYFFEIIEYPDQLTTATEEDRWNKLEILFPTNIPKWWVFRNVDENFVDWLVDTLRGCRENNKHYDVDGLVICEAYSERENVAYPKNKVAFKVNMDAVKTVVTGIDWKVTRTGLVCATLEVKPTNIQGVTITRVGAGINWEIMKERGMGIGAEIGVVRSGDVIPYVEEVYEPSDHFFSNELDWLHCPSCGHLVEESGVWLACPNNECERKKLWELEYWVRTLGAENLTIVTLEKIFGGLGIKPTIQNLYCITELELRDLEGFGKKKAKQIFEEIQSTLYTTHERLLSAFGISGIAKENSRELINYFGSVHKVLNASLNQLLEVEGVGNILAEQIRKASARCLDLLVDLEELYNLELEERKVGPLTGKVFAITGKLPLNRDSIVKMIEANGGIWKNSVTKKTDYLITDNPDSGSGKNKKAKAYGTKIINFEQLKGMLS